MATVVRRKKSRFWTACFTSSDGRQLKRSTKTEDKNRAMEIALEYERVERRAKQGILTTTQIQKVLNDVSERVIGDTIMPPTAEEYLNEWLERAGERSTPATVERYKHTAKLFLTSLGDKAQKPITMVTPKDAEIFLNSRIKAGLAPKTAIVDLKTINVAFRRAAAHGMIDKNPIVAVRPPKEISSVREVFTLEEIQKLVNSAPTLEWQTLILLGYFTAARLRDCVRMKWENVNSETGFIEYEQQKTGKLVKVPMHFHIKEHLKFLIAS